MSAIRRIVGLGLRQRLLSPLCAMSACDGGAGLSAGQAAHPAACAYSAHDYASSSFPLLRVSGACSSSPSSPFVEQRRFAQTLKDIEKHGAKGTSKLLRDLFPEIAMEVNTSSQSISLPSNVANTPATSGEVDLDTILFDSGRRVSWRCKQCSHSWVASVVSRTVLKRGCPSCHRRDNPLLAEINPRLVQELHPSKNTIFCEPESLEATDRQRLWWLCSGCSSSFQARVCDRVQGKAPCPDCDRGRFSDFKIKKVLLEEFHPTRNGDLTLAKLRPTDRVDVWWLCHTCGHEYVCPLSVRVSCSARGHSTSSGQGGCPKCFARKGSGKRSGVLRKEEGGVEGAKRRGRSKKQKKEEDGAAGEGMATVEGFTVDM